MKLNTVKFYDQYHKQSAKTAKLINRNNITYWHIIRLIERAEKNVLKKMILDIGCGVGTLSFYLSQKGGIVLGVDVSKRAIELAKHTQLQTRSSSVKFIHSGLSGTNDSAAPVQFISAKFDLIICAEVIEHIYDDSHLLIDCFYKLKNGGKLVLTTQRNDGLLAKIGFFSGHDARVGHYRRYDPSQLINLIEHAGFKILWKQDADGFIRSILYTTRLGILLKFIRGPLVPIFQWLDLQSIKLFGAADIQIIAVKS